MNGDFCCGWYKSDIKILEYHILFNGMFIQGLWIDYVPLQIPFDLIVYFSIK